MSPGRQKWLLRFGGVFAANLVGWGVSAVYEWLFRTLDPNGAGSGFLILSLYPNLFIVPALMGFAAAYVWRPLRMRKRDLLFWSFVTIALCVAGAYLFLKEGVVCLLIGSPLLWATIFASAIAGRELFESWNDKMNLLIFPFLIFAVFVDAKIGAERTNVVTDRIIVRALSAEVWRHVVAFPRITAQPDYWLNKVGLPSAAETTCEGEFVGAKRECIFSNGLVFKEVVAELEPERLLTFNIVEQPNDPELLGHLTLHRGQFQLQANSDGTTTLIGRSWYTLHVRPLWYFDWWTRDITRQVHLRVMEHIKRLSEHRG